MDTDGARMGWVSVASAQGGGVFFLRSKGSARACVPREALEREREREMKTASARARRIDTRNAANVEGIDSSMMRCDAISLSMHAREEGRRG